jgi:hypothetical protein
MPVSKLVSTETGGFKVALCLCLSRYRCPAKLLTKFGKQP